MDCNGKVARKSLWQLSLVSCLARSRWNLANSGLLEIKERQDLHTDLKRSRGLTGSLERMSMKISRGSWGGSLDMASSIFTLVWVDSWLLDVLSEVLCRHITHIRGLRRGTSSVSQSEFGRWDPNPF